MEINPNELKRIRNEEGLRNPDDVYELTPKRGIEIGSEVKNEQMELLKEDIRNFFAETEKEYQEAFGALIAEYKENKGLPSDKILEYLNDHNLDKPVFTLVEGGEEGLLANYGFEGERLGEGEVLAMFQLPKQLAQFWQKGGTESWGELGEDVGPMIIEWGHFYRELMEVVWEKIGYYESEKGIRFDRINGIGDHDPKLYYYIWKISRWED
ncbi:MAG: hypothetical protein COV70_01775 [Parcubacteria group bacterium CG11_big_fil_rev_8_21_14_0_20_39_22]|nr:MAG: hypothetical protein COV70_01775 [Parcubacteria group bacterium CG11_big_fil_rev_8_21_14_0_20_39_22]